MEIRRSAGDESVRISRQFLGITETNQRTAKDGSFRIKGVKPESKLQLVLKANGFTDRVLKDLSVEPGRTLDVGAVGLTEGGSALIVLADGGDSEGVTWVTLEPVEQGSRDQSKIELLRAGRARVGGLVAGKWTVTVEASDPGNGTQRRAGEPVEFEVRPGEEVRGRGGAAPVTPRRAPRAPQDRAPESVVEAPATPPPALPMTGFVAHDAASSGALPMSPLKTLASLFIASLVACCTGTPGTRR